MRQLDLLGPLFEFEGSPDSLQEKLRMMSENNEFLLHSIFMSRREICLL